MASRLDSTFDRVGTAYAGESVGLRASKSCLSPFLNSVLTAQVNGGSQSFNTVNTLRILGRWMRMFVIPNQVRPLPTLDYQTGLVLRVSVVPTLGLEGVFSCWAIAAVIQS